jgi:hypothetical protein
MSTDTRPWTRAQCHDEGHRIFVAVKKSGDYELAAGLLLIEAQERIKGIMTFRDFLKTCCREPGRPALQKTRAYALIAIAGGKKTVEEVRARSNASSQATRKRQRQSDAAVSAASGQKPATPKAAAAQKSNEKTGTWPTRTVSQENLRELLYAVDTRWPKLTGDDRTKFTTYVFNKSNERERAA